MWIRFRVSVGFSSCQVFYQESHTQTHQCQTLNLLFVNFATVDSRFGLVFSFKPGVKNLRPEKVRVPKRFGCEDREKLFGHFEF